MIGARVWARLPGLSPTSVWPWASSPNSAGTCFTHLQNGCKSQQSHLIGLLGFVGITLDDAGEEVYTVPDPGNHSGKQEGSLHPLIQ